MTDRTCSEPGCHEQVHSRGLCASHYGKAYRNGTLQLLLVERHSLASINRIDKTATCSVCGPARIRMRSDGTPECMTRRREQAARRRARNPHVRRKYKSDTPDAKRQRHLRRFGITPEDYARMFDEQGGVCAICHRESDGSLSIDHDHRCCQPGRSCGKCVRGLLCLACNLVLGYVRDNPALLASAIEYLARTEVQRAS
jgi:Recombination endonuclease VII